MYLNKPSTLNNSIKIFLRLYSIGRKSHYDILKLRQNCSDKEIKEAFIQLSKEYHPDKNKDKKAQEKFVNIVEAYNVLSKPGSRARYDNMTQIQTDGSYMHRTHVPYNYRNNSQHTYYYEAHSKSSGDTANKTRNAFYAMRARRLSNFVIVCICTSVAFFGFLLQVFVIRNLYVNQRRQAQEKSQILAEELNKVRSAATANGNELQTRLLMDKIVKAANPTVATASLGQALATEKKDKEDNANPCEAVVMIRTSGLDGVSRYERIPVKFIK